MKWMGLFGAALIFAGSAAQATPGSGDAVYGATIDPGKTEFEVRAGRLTGGSEGGADNLIFEVEHSFNGWSLGTLVETGRERGGRRSVEGIAFEAIHTLGRIEALAVDTAVYAEYKIGLDGRPDVGELKALFQHRAGAFDARLNLIAEKELRAGEPVEFGYAASGDWAVAGDELRLGLAAFGDFGTTRAFGGSQEHYIGPVAKIEAEHLGPGELEIEIGWLRAFGAARARSDGQARLLVGYEAHF